MAGKPVAGTPCGCEAYWVKARARFFKFIQRQHNGCWVWTGSFFSKKPYGQFSAGGKNWRAHRFSYEALRGAIPDGLTLDHLCRNPGCVNPEHLEPVPAVENIMRGFGPFANNARKFECKRGHPFVESNTHYTASGGRMCMECHRAKVRLRRANRSPEEIDRDRRKMSEYDKTKRDKKARAAAAMKRWRALPEEERVRRRARMNAYDAKRRST